MIVVDKDDHIWLGFLHPLLGKFITFEKWLPVGFLCLSLIQGRTNRRDMRRVNRGGNIGHIRTPWPGANSPVADDEAERHHLPQGNGYPLENGLP